MAKLEVKFLDVDEYFTSARIELYEDYEIKITINDRNSFKSIYFDKSTAIKFAKTLRTEINKIES